jgi:hypothetical protein
MEMSRPYVCPAVFMPPGGENGSGWRVRFPGLEVITETGTNDFEEAVLYVHNALKHRSSSHIQNLSKYEDMPLEEGEILQFIVVPE